ncbi:endosomal/lysosomal proton channel TMEM175 isoform X2 [Latimeria chalumnae]|uniref:endosomal/lysosomal proton channel TMEM175 isoform X2 n=1 Tax=Latimeria chalumnae TaxID=7897 RepID=UPI00313B6915
MSFADTEEIVEHHLSEEMEKGPEGTCRPSLLENEGASRTQSSHRLLAYSDALISIIATVMILPVSHTKIHPDQELEESIQQLLATKIAVYLMTFLIVTVAWAAHIRLFQVIEHIDDFLALLNLAAIVMYGFSKPYLLNCQIQISENQAFYKHHILKIILRAPALCFLAGVFSFFFFPLSYVFLVLVVVLPYITRLIQWCRGTKYSSREKESSDLKFYTYHHNEPFSKERVEAFSDGVYAIVATLLILDICEDNVPDPKEVKEKFHGSLVEALRSYGPEFLAYFGSFVTVGLLWFVHHSLFLHVTKPTRLMGLLNTFSLAFIGGLPLAYQLTHNFAKRSRNELEAIQVSCIIIFFASIFQFAIWTAALFNEKETLHPHARYGGHEHAFMFVKLSLYPCVSLVTFFLTCFLSKFSTAIFHLMEIIVPFAFLMLRIIVKIALMLIRMLFCPTTPKHTMLEEETRFPITESIS